VKSASNKLLNLIIALLFAGMLAVAANAPVLAHSSKKSGDASLPTLRWYGLAGTPTWAQTLDPSQVTDSISYNILNMVDANLVKLGPKGQVLHDLAYKWTISKNRRVYTFYLRPNARFSNGDPVTAQDEAFSITRSLAKATASPVALTYMGHIVGAAALSDGKTNTLAGVKVLGPHVLRITLDKPIVYFLKTLTYPTADVLDPRVIAGHAVKAGSYMTNTCAADVGAGPFRFVCRNKSSSKSSFYPPGSTPTITLVPNPYYYGPKPHIRVVMRAIPDTQTNYKDFLANGIDITGIPSADVAANRGKPGFYQFATSIVDYITPNEDMAPFNNVHCRLAVAYAINRVAITKDVLHGIEIPIYDVVPTFFLGYYSGKDNPHYNPTKAKQELAACPGGIHNVQIPYQHTSIDLDNEYRALQAMWASVGIGITPKPLTFNDWLGIVAQSLDKTHTQITENLWIEDYPDPQDYCTNLLRAGENYDIGDFNNPTYNKLVDQAEVETNKKVRAQLYIKAQHIALSQGAWISVGQQNGYFLVKPWVHGFVGSPAFGEAIPKDNNWANITISQH
jgi:ABC-type transport system substrate-binding protein